MGIADVQRQCTGCQTACGRRSPVKRQYSCVRQSVLTEWTDFSHFSLSLSSSFVGTNHATYTADATYNLISTVVVSTETRQTVSQPASQAVCHRRTFHDMYTRPPYTHWPSTPSVSQSFSQSAGVHVHWFFFFFIFQNVTVSEHMFTAYKRRNELKMSTAEEQMARV